MSVEALAVALHHSRATGTAKLVLIGVANHEGDGGAWPSVETLAKYAGGVNRRNVQRALEKLEALHEIKRVVQAGGDHRTDPSKRPNRYHVTLRCPADCDGSTAHRTTRDRAQQLPVEELSTGAALAPPGGGSAAPGAAVAPPKPSLNHPNTSREKSHVGNRARERGACGHQLIDDRHCERGCRADLVTERKTA